MNKKTISTLICLVGLMMLGATPVLAAPSDVIITGKASTSTIPNAPKPLYIIDQNTSDPLSDAGIVWYSNDKPMQELAKDTFDAINNDRVYLE